MHSQRASPGVATGTSPFPGRILRVVHARSTSGASNSAGQISITPEHAQASQIPNYCLGPTTGPSPMTKYPGGAAPLWDEQYACAAAACAFTEAMSALLRFNG